MAITVKISDIQKELAGVGKLKQDTEIKAQLDAASGLFAKAVENAHDGKAPVNKAVTDIATLLAHADRIHVPAGSSPAEALDKKYPGFLAAAKSGLTKKGLALT
jgi:hypothetical protein